MLLQHVEPSFRLTSVSQTIARKSYINRTPGCVSGSLSVVLLRREWPVIEQFKSIYAVIRHNPSDVFIFLDSGQSQLL